MTHRCHRGAVDAPVAIPGEVEKECCGVKKSLDALLIQKALDELRLKVIAVKNRKLVVKLQGDFGLGRGEAEAIVLAREGCPVVVGLGQLEAGDLALVVFCVVGLHLFALNVLVR